ncbi:MAG: hypothetical protein P9M01_01855 [Candidatus Kappaea frigidicola]|nr:hypothetical protein [Candidatus Kappaea frigidicola]
MNRLFLGFLHIIFAILYLNTFAYAADFVYNNHERRDPFVPPYLKDQVEKKPKDVSTKTIVDFSSITLQAVVYDPTGESAVIINGQIMKINDETDFFVIKDIMRDGAVVEVLGERKVFKLREEKNNINDEE